MFYVYILQSLICGRYYIGSCDNIENRFKQHNDGKVKSTKAFIPWKFMYQRKFKTRKDAVARVSVKILEEQGCFREIN